MDTKERASVENTTESPETRISWLARLPTLVWLALIPILFMIYVFVVALIQLDSQYEIRSYATQTAAAIQATAAMQTAIFHMTEVSPTATSNP